VPVPSCKGHNPAAAATAKAEGLKHYRASKHEGPADAEMASALGFFEAACAAGDDSALELRAYALAGVERFVEAAQTLDAFLAIHPLDSLPPATRARLAQQQPEILGRVVSLTIETPAPGAHVTLNHQSAGVTPLPHLRLAPGRYDIEVTPEGQPAITRSLDLVAGERTETFGPPAPGPTDARVALPPPTVDTGSSPTNLHPWALGTAIGAGVLLAAGIGGAVWANERSNTYNGALCDGTSRTGCASTLSQYYDARDLEIVGFVGAGLGAIASGVLFYLDHKSGSAPAAAIGSGGDGLSCSFRGAGVSCGARF
jgi:hypothetical protein